VLWQKLIAWLLGQLKGLTFLSVLSWPVPQRERLIGEGPHLDVGPWHTAPAAGIHKHREVGWMAARDVASVSSRIVIVGR